MKKTATPNEYSEDALIEQPAIELLSSLGWQTANLFYEAFGQAGTEGRASNREVILVQRLRAALEKLNPGFPTDAYDQAIEQLTRDRSTMIPVNASREFYQLLKNGVEVIVKADDGSEMSEKLRVIDWENPTDNDFFVASQFWVRGDLYLRRCDLVAFVNGLPLVVVEFKAPHVAVKDAFNDNLRDYRNAIPHLFTPNALVILSNGSDTRLGTLTSEWEHFFDWKRINDENEQGVISLETALRGVCAPARLLDLIENFTVFEEVRGGLVRKVAKNHQYLGVNRAISAVREIAENQGRLGVFWHTQGSGKSLSMVFFTQKILRKLTGNWTFVVVTDRDELDDQIYKTFAATGSVTEKEAQATSSKHLQQLLREDHRYVFTLIHKFRTESGQPHPVLSTRKDIIVITDEAHRSQYDTLALNMRNALPNAAFIGFTGTPLIAGQEERTRQVFGDYVSVYNFRQSIQDGATVPLYYENRIPQVQLTNENLNEEIEQILEDAELDEAQEKRLEREFARQYHIITRDERLETIAADVVNHFLGRGYQGKAMMICIDKATAVRMYDKVQAQWKLKLEELRQRRASARPEEQIQLDGQIAAMERTDMAVVVSQAQNEIEDLQEKGLDIKPHRERILKEDLDEKFKDPKSNLRFVFVCAMWITGFDVPNCSTIYLDKPMKNHTLMQTIARANRVAPGKAAGLIVDYIGVFRNLQKALAIYAAPASGGDGADTGGSPIENKQVLVSHLKQAVSELKAYCGNKGVDLAGIQKATGFAKTKLLDDAIEALIGSEDEKKEYLAQASQVTRIYKAILPDASASELAPDAVLFSVLADKIRALTPPADIADVMQRVEELLDRSIASEGYVIEAQQRTDAELVDLSKIDFDALAAKFTTAGHQRTEAEKLRGLINGKLRRMIRLNPSRLDFQDRFQKLIDDYNAGSINLEFFFAELMKFAQSLNEEEKRTVSENLSEEELAIFDILTRPEPSLSDKEEQEVKKVAKELLEKLKWEKLVIDWRSKQQTRAAVRDLIEETLDQLPTVYTKDLYDQKCAMTYQHIYSSYQGPGQSVYQAVPR